MATGMDVFKPAKSVSGRLSTEDLRRHSNEIEAAAAFKILCGCWPNANPHDPEIYDGAVKMLFQKYPPAAIARVCDPIIGLPSKLSFLPTLHDLRLALEDEMKPIYDAQRDRKAKLLLEQYQPSEPTPEEKARVEAIKQQTLIALSK